MVHICNKYLLSVAVAGLALQSYAGQTWAHDREADEVKVIATGLLSPRGLDFAPNGQLYVAEAGVTTDSGPCFTGGMGTQCYTETGALTRVDPWGIHSPRQVLKKLPTLGDAGPSDVSFFGMTAYVTIGLGSDPANRAVLSGLGAAKAAQLGTVIRANPHWGNYQVAADISALEAGNPDGGSNIDSNPNGLLALPGRIIVADAGGNDLIEVKANGQKRVLAVFNPYPGAGGVNREVVPTNVALGPDGYLYVSSLFFGQYFGPPGGSARIYRVPLNGCLPVNDCEVFADGFSTIMDLEFDRRGNLYVLEYLESGFGSPGALLKMDRHGTRTTITDALSFPAGLALSDDAAYVSNKGICYGVANDSCVDGEYGEVLRIPLDDDSHGGHGGHGRRGHGGHGRH